MDDEAPMSVQADETMKSPQHSQTREDDANDTANTIPEIPSASLTLNHPPTSRPSYVSQFSASNLLILDRIKQQSRTSASPRHSHSHPTLPTNDVNGEASSNSDSSVALTLEFPISKSHELDHDVSTHPLRHKRKRSSEGNIDFTQNTIPFPTPISAEPSSRLLGEAGQTDSPKRPRVTRCSKCQRRQLSPDEPMTSCRLCSSSWHSQCLPPEVLTEPVPHLGFVCASCLGVPQRGSANVVFSSSSQMRQQEIERMREKRLAALPDDVVLPPSGLVGFGGGHAPDIARAEYFFNKRKNDLLNIISFCDQLEPRLLVDVLVSVSKKHPGLPIFDSPDWASRVPSSSTSKALASVIRKPKVLDRPRHGHVLHPKMKQRGKAGRGDPKLGSIEVEVESPLDEEDTMPMTWPKAGQGLYATLVPEVEDRTFLLDRNDEEAFSHFMVDKLGKQIVQPV